MFSEKKKTERAERGISDLLDQNEDISEKEKTKKEERQKSWEKGVGE